MLIEHVRLAMGITTDAFDIDITGLIDACKIDLRLAGVNVIDDEDALTIRAIIFYCKAYFRNNDNSERYAKAYESLKNAMALAGEYSTEVDANE